MSNPNPEKLIVDAKFPEKLAFLFKPSRYKVARGGRWSGKSWGFARALLILGVQRKLRILCAREIQKSIKDSVHKLLSDQITMLGLQHKYDILSTEIRGRNGTEILFSGLLEHTIESIKSFEGVDIIWIEEGQTVSDRSWKILIPTIRKSDCNIHGIASDSEIWISYNPDLDTDPTHQRFTVKPPPNCINVLMNHRDNPWFSALGETERQTCLRDDPDGYPNIWEGQCRPAVEGAIYFKQIQEMTNQGRICRVPHDPMLKTHIVVDIGRSDYNPMGMFQVLGSDYRMIDYIPGRDKQDWGWYNAELRTRRYNWGKMWLPHDGHAKRMDGNGRSSADILKKFGWDVAKREESSDMSVEEGIKITRLKFAQLRIDAEKCALFIDSIKRYRRHVNASTGAEGTPLHDDNSHDADMLRYFSTNVDSMRNENERRFVPDPSTTYEPHDAHIGL